MTGPDGRRWEIYAYRLRLGRRRRPSRDPLHLLALVAWHLPRALLRARAADEWTIEAVSWFPRRTSYAWTTTGEFRGHVLARVEGQLARGELPTPAHATFLGAET